MHKRMMAVALAALLPLGAQASMNDDPTLVKVLIDQLEWRQLDGPDALVVEGDAWIGKDIDKAWLKFSGEKVGAHWESAEVQALYSRALAPYWDIQGGLRHDIHPNGANRNWLALGLRGLARYFFDVDSSLYLGDRGNLGLDFKAEYEARITQRLILSPELKARLYSKADRTNHLGSGLSSTELGLRLRYEIRPEIAPYLGVNWDKTYGGTAGLRRNAGEKTSDVQFVAGVRIWF